MSEWVEKGRIAYALISFDAAHSGVYRKVFDQVAFWKSSGYSVQLFVITDAESASLWKAIDENVVILFDSNRLSKIRNRYNLTKLAIKSKPSLGFDLIGN